MKQFKISKRGFRSIADKIQDAGLSQIDGHTQVNLRVQKYQIDDFQIAFFVFVNITDGSANGMQ